MHDSDRALPATAAQALADRWRDEAETRLAEGAAMIRCAADLGALIAEHDPGRLGDVAGDEM